MNKAYTINTFALPYVINILLSVVVASGAFFGLYSVIRHHASFIFLLLGWMMVAVSSFILWLSLFYFNKLKIVVDDENVVYAMPDKIVKFKLKDIYRIERDFSYAGTGYYVFFYNDNGQKRHVKFNQDITDDAELLDYLQRKSGIKMRWEGTVDVRNENRPLIKVLKIVWNVFIVTFIIGTTVVYPLVAHSNREKEQRLHLPERSLWP